MLAYSPIQFTHHHVPLTAAQHSTLTGGLSAVVSFAIVFLQDCRAPPLWENWSEIQPGDSLGMRFVDAAFDQLFSVRAIRRVVVICSPILWFLNNYVPFCRFSSIELLKKEKSLLHHS